MSEQFAARWEGDGFTPLPRFRKECDKQFVIGENYILETIEERSGPTHRHYFAAIREAWANLPESLGEQFPTELHFRKRLLIETGFCDIEKTVFSNANDAIKAAALVLGRDDYSVAKVDRNVLTIWTAKSQALRKMKPDVFQDSKQKTLDLAASMIGSDVATLTRHTAQAEA